MRKFTFCLLASLVLWGCQQDPKRGQGGDFGAIPVSYPETFQDTSVRDTYFNIAVADPYRWLEDDRSAPTARWVEQQQDVTAQYLAQLPGRAAIKQRLQEIWDYERYDTPRKAGGYYYYFKNDGLQPQPVLYRLDKLEGEPQPVLDPNTFSEDGTSSVGNYAFSQDGSLLAFQRSDAGSDWKTIMIKDMEQERMLDDTIRWVKFSNIAWYRSGFFYSRYPKPKEDDALSGSNQFHQVYYHRVGTDQSEDELVFADHGHPQRNVYAWTTEDERFLVLSQSEGTSGNALYFRPLDEDGLFTPIVESFDADFTLAGSDGKALYLLTNRGAPNQRLIRVDVRRPEERYWREVLPELENRLQSVELVGNAIVAHYLQNAYSTLSLYSMDGNLQKRLVLPDMGTVLDVNGKQGEQEAFIAYTNFLMPTTIYRLDLEAESLLPYRSPQLNFDSEYYEVKQVAFESYDGTEVPMFIIHKKGVKLDGNSPALLYGYGGFNISVTPAFNRTRNMLFPLVLENGGICAVANIRGGGEFGERWHKAGTKHNKQNVFDDFQAAAEYLIAKKYTSTEKLAIYGRSNGGLLVGACMTQRPDLYAVAMPAVGVLDMLRYHKFTIGWAWASDYGRSDKREDFDYLYAYSPLHNISEDAYPATLITTADHDDRVVPAHSFKFAATLQQHQNGEDPVLIRIEERAGHGAGVPTAKRIEEGADLLAFMFYHTQTPVNVEATNQ
ncbi:MAG: prolyl oligopeptidase family serine peptidase [Bacteroidetes bacterium]|jgi:prolyl oligopeptidase|nr:prolyl oligopeptidase family serine peptidase [Bacteroidota bacterium]